MDFIRRVRLGSIGGVIAPAAFGARCGDVSEFLRERFRTGICGE
jgi:hypothetical protein